MTKTSDHRAPKIRKVLIADDNRDAAISLGMLLEIDGHEVRIAHDGAEAVEVFEQFKPELVLLDIGMPKLNGYEVAVHICKNSNGHRPVLVAVTGWGQTGDKARALEAGFDHHLTKPIDPQQLNQLLHTESQE